jgi:hypothetical protein
MGMQEARGTLAKSFKELMLRWNEARAQWDDVQAEQFEETFLTNLESDLKVTGSAMEQMAVLLHQVRRDCE